MEKFIKSFILSALFLALAGTGTVWAAEVMPDQSMETALTDGLSMDAEPQMPGRVESTGIYFEVKDSEWLNVSLSSSELIKLTLESVPNMINMNIAAAAGAASTQITIGGLAPETTYHKYEDNYHNHEAFTTDDNGSYTYTQDLSVPHMVFIQTKKSTKFIKDDGTGGDCYSIGFWDSPTKTCTMTMDLNETIQIDSDGVTLDGNGHTLTGSKTGSGVYFNGRSSITIKNLNIKLFAHGIYLVSSSNNSLTDNNTSNNIKGIYLESSSNNNTIAGNLGAGISIRFSNSNTLIGNTVSKNFAGISLYGSNSNILTGNTASGNYGYVPDGGGGINLSGNCSDNVVSNNNLFNNSAGIASWGWGNNNFFSGNSISNNIAGIHILGPRNTVLVDNTSYSNAAYGIFIQTGESPVTLKGNKMWGNKYNFATRGIGVNSDIDTSNTVDGKPIYFIKNASNQTFDASTNAGVFYCLYCSNVIIESLTLTNNQYGVYLYNTNNSTIRNITVLKNITGAYLYASSNNTIYNNNFINNYTRQAYVSGGSNNIFYLPTPIGGNYWSDYDTSAEGCYDNNGDGFCDVPYVFTGGQDSLPLTKGNPTDTIAPTTTISLSGTAGNNGWYLSDVQSTLAATDNEGGSGVAKTEYGFNGTNWYTYTGSFTVNTEGQNTLYYRSTDNAGNTEAARTQTVKIDKTPPTIAAILSGTLGDNGWYISDVEVTLTAADSYSGVDEIHYVIDGVEYAATGNTATFALTEDGSHVIRYWAVDNAGIMSEYYEYPVNRDSAPPVTSPSITGGTQGSGGYYTSCVTVALQTTSSSSGTAVTEYSLDGGQTWQVYTGDFEVCNTGTTSSEVTVTYRSGNTAGIKEGPKTLTINIDQMPPVITAAVAPDANQNGWHNTDITVTFTCTDSTSGIAHCPSPITISSEGAGQIVSGTAVDKAGNFSNISVTLNIDMTAPVITVTSPAAIQYDHSATLNISFTADDNVSGVYKTTVYLNGQQYDPANPIFLINLSLGIHTLKVESENYAGLMATQSVDFEIIATAGGTTSLVTTLYQTGAIDSAGMVTGLTQQLQAAQAAISSGQTVAAQNILEAFINMLEAQSGKHISTSAAEILMADAVYMIGQL